MSMGDTTWRSGDVASAARFYQAAVEAAPKDPDAAFRLGRALQAMGAHKAAEKNFRKVLTLRPGDREAKRQLANTLIALDNPQAAIKLYREVIATDSDYRAFNGLGVALDMTGKHEDALAAYRAGLAKKPKSLTLKSNLALSMALAGEYKNAAKVLQSVTAHPQATARHRQNLALVYGLAGQDEQAARVARVDLDGPSVARNLDYYNWLRRQPRWMVKKMLRKGAPAKPMAASTKPRSKAKPRPEVRPSKASRKMPRTTVRKPVRATPREAVRPVPRRENVAAPRRVDQAGIVRLASLPGGEDAAPIRFARLEFGFRPVKDAQRPETTGKTGGHETATARLEPGLPAVDRPVAHVRARMPVVIRGSGKPVQTAAAKPVVRQAAKAKSTTPEVKQAAAPQPKVIRVARAAASKVVQAAAPKVVRVAAAPNVVQVVQKVEVRFIRSGLEHLMGDAGKTKRTATN
jgi:Flp pilus assembly protein TadD